MAPKGNGNNPFDMLKNLGDMQDIRKVLGEDFFKHLPLPQWQQTNPDENDQAQGFPRVDLFERNQELIVILEIPGLSSPNEIALSTGPHYIFIKGVIAPLPTRDAQLHLSERYHGPFEREIELPVRVDETSVQASYSQGLLTIRVNKYQADGTKDQVVPIQFD